MRRVTFWEGVAASLVAAVIVLVVSWIVALNVATPTSALAGAVAAAALVAALSYGLFLRLRPRLVRRDPYLSLNAVERRIAAADSEIWSFQISGGDFTVDAVRQYEEWLKADPHRRLLLLFANPDNDGLLETIVRLSGRGEIDSEDGSKQLAITYLREAIRTSLQRYDAMSLALPTSSAGTYPSQVEIRTYDCAPPCSVHAVDPNDPVPRRGSFFIELYLPDLAWDARPCLRFGRAHPLFRLYRNQSLAWFESSVVWSPDPNTAGGATVT